MTSSLARHIAPALVALLLGACGDQTGPQDMATASDTAPGVSTASQAPTIAGLTAEEMAAQAPLPIATERTEAPGTEEPRAPTSTPTGEQSGPATELEWDALIPEEWQPDKIMARYNADELEDDDPRAQTLMDELQALWKEAPVVEDLNGTRVKLPGFVVPLETDGEIMAEFLLVPYYGACIHVPPPPANQTVHVLTRQGKEYQGELFDTVWVTGTLRVESSSSDLAEAGYRLDATDIEPYE